MFTSPLSLFLYPELMKNLHNSRRLLLHDLLSQTPPPMAAKSSSNLVDPTEPYSGSNGFDANVVMVLSVLLCALVCSLGLNSIVKCALRCSRFRSTTESNDNTDDPATRLANTGIKKKALKSFAVVNYSPDLNLPGLDTECAICLSDFAQGERVRLLPRCNHGFHAKCIDKWLNSHSSCPTCRQCLIETCQKIVGCDQATSSQPTSQSQSQSQPQPQPPEATVINIAPLEREDLVRAYRCNNS